MDLAPPWPSSIVRGGTDGGSHQNVTAGPFCLTDRNDVVDDAGRNIDPGSVDAVAELHGVVDLVDQQTAVAFEEIDGDHPTADRFGGRLREPVQLISHRAVAGRGAASGVRDPVRRIPIDGADRLVADDEGADIASRFAHELLNVKRTVVK